MAELPGSGPALDPRLVTRRHVIAFQVWMIETRSPTTVVNKHKSLQQFFRWLLEKEEIERSPIEGVPLPKVGQKLIPVVSDAETQEILGVWRGNSFLQPRDQALVQMYYNTGARLSEIGCLMVTDLDLDTNSVLLHSKGGKDRRVRFGPKTARILTRCLLARNRRDGISDVKELWIADRGTRPLKSSGIKIRLKRSGEKASLSEVCAPVAAQLRPRMETGRRSQSLEPSGGAVERSLCERMAAQYRLRAVARGSIGCGTAEWQPSERVKPYE